MKTITITDFTSVESLILIGNQIEENRQESLASADKEGISKSIAGQTYMPFEIKCDNKKWICRCIGNGTPFDCWIFKKGTQGATSKTFKRVSAIKSS